MTLSRRDFLKASSLFAAWTALAACTPIQQSNDPGKISPTSAIPVLNDDLIFHTLQRITFGPTPQMIDKAKKMGLNAFLEEQLSPESIPDTKMDSILEGFPTLKLPLTEILQLDKKGQPVEELIEAAILRGLYSERQFYETMVDLWSNHFNIYIKKGLCRVLKTADDIKVIRPNALGKFGELLNASAHSPAMLVFLDQWESEGIVPNENYARELMELHTLGTSSAFTEEDVLEAARVLTGWSVIGPYNQKNEPGTFAFKSTMHTPGSKTILGVTIPSGGEGEGNALLDMLAHHSSTAQSISKKLARRFVSDNPSTTLINSLAQVFTDTEGDIRAILRALINSEDFRSSAGQKLKRPLDFFLSTLRLTETTVDDYQTANLEEHLRLLGQVPFMWDTPSGFPDMADHWVTSSGLLERWNFGLALTLGQIKGTTIDVKSLVKDASSGQDIVDVLSIRFLGAPLPSDARSILIDFISSGDLDKNIPSVAGLILGSPHFQVR